MSETHEPSTPTSPGTPPPVVAPAPNSERLYQAAAWVAIIAGITLILVVLLKFAWVFWS
ncbi:hypothetical protein [Mycobacterium cookii]|nr:hypothetical protein [Mycobacterium cookii]MCV7331564.1 hypothetical protein [Mycobacterium cookii]